MSSLAPLLLLLAVQVPGFQDEVRLLGVETHPGEVRTGQAFRLVLRIQGPEGTHLSFPDSLPEGGAFRPMGAVTVEPLSLDRGGMTRESRVLTPGEFSLAYPLQALRPGLHPLPPLRLRLESPDPPGDGEGEGPAGSSRWGLLSPGSMEILSVLPPDQEEIQPAGPVHFPEPGGRPLPGLLTLAGGLCTGLLGLALRVARRQTPSDPKRDPHRRSASMPSLPEARERLVRILQEHQSGSGEGTPPWEEAFVLLRILAGQEEEGGAQTRTTAEILGAVHRDERGEKDILRETLERGDGMRFSGDPVSPEDAQGLLELIGQWMEAGDA